MKSKYQNYIDRDKYMELNSENIKLKKSFISCKRKNFDCRPYKCKYCEFQFQANNKNLELLERVYHIFLLMITDKNFDKNKYYNKGKLKK